MMLVPNLLTHPTNASELAPRHVAACSENGVVQSDNLSFNVF